MTSIRNRKVIGITSELTVDDWEDIFSHKWVDKYRLVLEVLRDNNNRPTLIGGIQKKSPKFYVGERDRINDVFRRLGKPYFVSNVGYGPRNACFQIVRR